MLDKVGVVWDVTQKGFFVFFLLPAGSPQTQK